MRSRVAQATPTALALTHTVVYALVVATVAIVASLLVSAASGGGLVRVKGLLFLIGWGLMAYAVFQLWPSSPEELKAHENETLESGFGAEGEQLSRIERLLAEYPPTAWLPTPPPGTRVDERMKLFLASILVLFVSYLLETVFGAT